jgi:hypothetical protein
MNYGADELDGSGMTRQLRTSICGMYSCSCPSRVSGSIHGLVVSLIMLIEGAPSFAMFRYSRNCAGCVREHVTPHHTLGTRRPYQILISSSAYKRTSALLLGPNCKANNSEPRAEVPFATGMLARAFSLGRIRCGLSPFWEPQVTAGAQ